MCHDHCPAPVTGGAPLDERMDSVSRDDAEIPVLLVQPEGSDNSLPGIVLIHDIWGANDFYHDVARRLANDGYRVALPDLFHREGPLPEPTREAAMARGGGARQADQLADLAAVLEWLKTQTGEDQHLGSRLGMVGFCMGGTLTMLCAAREPKLAVGVGYYGFPARPGTDNAPIRPVDVVPDVHTPVLGLWGDGDAGVGMDTVAAWSEKMQEHGKPHGVEIYPGVGHGFLTFDPNDDRHAASQQAWERMRGYLASHLS